MRRTVNAAVPQRNVCVEGFSRLSVWSRELIVRYSFYRKHMILCCAFRRASQRGMISLLVQQKLEDEHWVYDFRSLC